MAATTFNGRNGRDSVHSDLSQRDSPQRRGSMTAEHALSDAVGMDAEQHSAKKRKRRNKKKGKRSKSSSRSMAELGLGAESNGNPLQNIIHDLLSNKEDDDEEEDECPSALVPKDDALDFAAAHSSCSDRDDDGARNGGNVGEHRSGRLERGNGAHRLDRDETLNGEGRRRRGRQRLIRDEDEDEDDEATTTKTADGDGRNAVNERNGGSGSNGNAVSGGIADILGVGGSGADRAWYKKYYGHDLETLRLVSFDLTQIAPFIKAFEHQVVLSQDGPLDEALSNNLRETVLLQNKLLSGMLTEWLSLCLDHGASR